MYLPPLPFLKFAAAAAAAATVVVVAAGRLMESCSGRLAQGCQYLTPADTSSLSFWRSHNNHHFDWISPIFHSACNCVEDKHKHFLGGAQVQLVGLKGCPDASDTLKAFATESDARACAEGFTQQRLEARQQAESGIIEVCM